MTYPENLRALSIAGAYPWLIATGEKQAEYRTWPIDSYRGLVLLHNSTTTEWDDSWNEIVEDGDITREETRQMKGSLIGFAFLTNCTSAQPDGYDGFYHWMEGPARFPATLACPGARNYWRATRPEQQEAFTLAWHHIRLGKYDAVDAEATQELLVEHGHRKPRIWICGPGGHITTNTGS